MLSDKVRFAAYAKSQGLEVPLTAVIRRRSDAEEDRGLANIPTTEFGGLLDRLTLYLFQRPDQFCKLTEIVG